MLRLAVASDSHGAVLWLEKFLALCRRECYDAVYHLGDYEADARWLERRLDCPMIAVAGNCDTFSKQARMALNTWEDHRILAVHGHLQDVKYGYDRLSYFAEEQGAGIALFGHTHRQYVGYEGRVLLVNPGALQIGDFAELTLDGRRIIPVEKNLADIRLSGEE